MEEGNSPKLWSKLTTRGDLPNSPASPCPTPVWVNVNKCDSTRQGERVPDTGLWYTARDNLLKRTPVFSLGPNFTKTANHLDVGWVVNYFHANSDIANYCTKDSYKTVFAFVQCIQVILFFLCVFTLLGAAQHEDTYDDLIFADLWSNLYHNVG